MTDELVTREEAQQAFETLCKYLWQSKNPNTVLCLFMCEEYDSVKRQRFITLHNADHDFEMRCYKEAQK